MSIRQGLLALLEQGPMYGYQLRAEFESRTGATWPLNVGQVYTTLARLERDGLVEPAGADGEGHVFYRVTDGRPGRGRDLVRTPVSRTAPAPRRAGDQARHGGHGARRRRPGRRPGPAHGDDPRAAGLHPAQGPSRRPTTPAGARLAARPRLAGVRRRGRGPLAGPLRGAAGPGRRRAAGRAGTPADPTSTPTARRGASDEPPSCEIRDLTRVHGHGPRARCTPCAA